MAARADCHRRHAGCNVLAISPIGVTKLVGLFSAASDQGRVT